MSTRGDDPREYRAARRYKDTEKEGALPAEAGVVVEGAVPVMSAGGGGGDGKQPAPWRQQQHRAGVAAAAWWQDWQLPVFVVLFTFVGVLAITFVILLWVKNHMLSAKREPAAAAVSCPPKPSGSGETQWIIHPVLVPPIQPSQPQHLQCLLAEVMSDVQEDPEETRKQNREPTRIKAKGLLERRGSSASLTIELLPTNQGPPLVTPTRECPSEEYLLSAGNVLSRSMLRLCLRDTRALHREFWDLPLNHPERAPVVGCGPKNRYRSILPNERTRVKLRTEEEDSLAEYINANYLRGYEGLERAYIATQGPLPHTTADFWLLVWQEHVPAIVMVTRLCEQGRVKCEQYLPLEVGACCAHGDVSVVLVGAREREGHTVRELRVKRGQETRVVLHFWYETWPDHKTPAGARDLLSLAEEVEMLRRVGVDRYLANQATPSSSEASPLFYSANQDSPAASDRTSAPASALSQMSPFFFAANQTLSPFPAANQKSPSLLSSSQTSPLPVPLSNQTSPLASGTNPMSPFFPSINQASPLFASTNHASPLNSSTNKVSPGGGLTNEEAPGWPRPKEGRSFFQYECYGSPPSCSSGDRSTTPTRECPLHGPVLVHCSAGIGRTGCFIAVSVGINQLIQEGNVDILGIVCQMRTDRGGMIQTAEQYEFVHRALCLFEQSLPGAAE